MVSAKTTSCGLMISARSIGISSASKIASWNPYIGVSALCTLNSGRTEGSRRTASRQPQTRDSTSVVTWPKWPGYSVSIR